MKEIRLKYIFIISSACLLFLMLLSGRDAGITCDEVLHYRQSVSVYRYFATSGEDRSALNTLGTHLKYYGQSYDNLATILINWFKIGDIYGFRHAMSIVAGWITIMITAAFAIWLADYRAGIIVLVIFSVSPSFMGHSQNNLKDIPFALGYIAGTFSILRFLFNEREKSISCIILLIVSFAFCISIRAGGLVLICYLFLFFFLLWIFNYQRNRVAGFTVMGRKLLTITGISIASWLSGIALWPFALQSPVRNVIESYHVMANFPDTFRQIFEGRYEWSDFMPWYYLPKSMVITVPLIILSGLLLFILFSVKLFRGRALIYGFIIFTVLFPVLFVIGKNSNLYSSWRQFLFIYPGIVLLASTGIHYLFLEYRGTRYIKWGAAVIFLLLLVHPVKYMLNNNPYWYLYYNQLVGGLKGAFSNYDTDYYYVSQTEASRWLIDYLQKREVKGEIKVMVTFSDEWSFRNNPEIKTSYLQYGERSQADWDYAITANRYIVPYHLKNKTWPPKNSIHTVYADGVPVCAVLERKTKDDYNGYVALSEGRYEDAVRYYETATKIDDKDEMIFFNFAAALYSTGQYVRADSILMKGLEINPGSEPILMYLGNIAKSQNNKDEAIMYYEKVIDADRKYFEAYVELSELLFESDLMRARALLRTCLIMNPRYKPAIISLAHSYKDTNPDIARKYYELANTIE